MGCYSILSDREKIIEEESVPSGTWELVTSLAQMKLLQIVPETQKEDDYTGKWHEVCVVPSQADWKDRFCTVFTVTL